MQYAVDTYGMGGRVELSHAEALERTKEALKAEGFGVLCEIDIQATLKAKINVDRPPYVILGACNPALANQALSAEPDLGLLLPCNVVVFEEGGSVWVKAIEPEKMLSVTGNPALKPIADQVRAKLERVLASIAPSPAYKAPLGSKGEFMFGLFGKPQVETISPEELQARLEAKAPVLVLDVREPNEYAGGHIQGSRLIPLGTLEARLFELPKDQAIVTVCRSGGRSGMAAKLLSDSGYQVKNMVGGMLAWRGPVAR